MSLNDLDFMKMKEIKKGILKAKLIVYLMDLFTFAPQNGDGKPEKIMKMKRRI